MGKQCITMPTTGQALFNSLKKGLGYETAKEVFLKGISPKFINDHKKELQFDDQGIPTRESLLNTSYMKQLLGDGRIAKNIEAQYTVREDTDSNYNALVNQAYSFNNDSKHKDRFVALVEYKDNDKIGISVYPKTQSLLEKALNQYASAQLNTFMAEEFKDLGITVGTLSQAEVQAGRVGVTDFSKVRGIAKDFSSVIRISKNMEGAQALSEEWCHMIVGALKAKNNPLINRAINSLSQNTQALQEILGEDYADIVDFHQGDMLEVAEEALGHILRDNLIKETINKNLPSRSLLQRTKDNIIKQFESYDPNRVEEAILNAQSSMNTLATEILSGNLQLNQEDIENSYRLTQFNALSDRIQRALDVLKEAKNIELKRKDVYKDADLAILQNIKEHLTDDAEVVAEGILQYAKHAVDRMKELKAGFQNKENIKQKDIFPFIRKAKIYVDSYAKFIYALGNLYQQELKENEDDVFTKEITIGNETIDMNGLISELVRYSHDITTDFVELGIPAFAKILEPFLGENLTKILQDKLDTDNVVEALLRRAPGDITSFDRWLDSLGNSSDVILQLFDAVVKQVKDDERFKTINDIKEIQKLMLEAESKGITSFEWAFEHYTDGGKTGEYTSTVNQGQFRRDQSEFLQYLKDKYGANPTGEKAKEMLQERDAWVAEHSASKFNPNQPSLTKYRNKEYDALTADQKDILKKFLDLKRKYDKKLPDGRAYDTKAIQRRKPAEQRFLDSLSSPSKIYDNIKESIKDAFLDAEDDDSIFGTSKDTKGIKGFDGYEFMSLPIVYTNRLNNPDELSTDIFGSLAAYAHMANRYEAMDKVIDTLEVGKTLIQERDVTETRGGNPLVEKLKDGAETITTFINKGKTNQALKIRDYMRSQVYQRHMVDHGAVGKVNISKTTNWLLKLGSMCTMAFNWLADTANVANAIALANIEAICGEYFNVSELLYADKEYTAAMGSYIPELASRIKTNKLWLTDELLEIRQNFSEETQRKLKKNLAERIFGKNWGSIGQEAGNHWLMNRVAIAYMSRIKVNVPGKGEMNLWQALTVSNQFEDNDKIKKVGLPEGTTLLNGNEVNLKKIGREIAQINQDLLGIYNQDDANSANQVALGKIVQQYRNWMKPILNVRFQPRRANVLMDKETEGFYVTAFKLGRDLVRAKFQIGEVWDQLDDWEKKNVKRFATELVQLALVFALVNLVEWPDDEDRPWAIKFAQYMATRELKELAGITPFGLRELGKTVREPFPIMRQIDDAVTVIYSLMDTRDYYTVMESGPYKGFTRLEKNIMNAPLPVVAQWKQVEKFGTGLEDAMKWYVKP